MGFLSAVFERTGLRLCGQVLDTAVLAAWVPPRAPAEGDRSWSPAEISPGLSEAASAFGLPVHRLHEAGGEALTTAQLFMALASHLDQVHPQSVGSTRPALLQKRGLQPAAHSVRLSAEEEHASIASIGA